MMTNIFGPASLSESGIGPGSAFVSPTTRGQRPESTAAKMVRWTLFRLMLEFGDVALALPKLDMVTIHELLGVFFGGVVVGADKLDRPHELAVNTDNASSVLGHLTGPLR
jgi:hypothetical protein